MASDNAVVFVGPTAFGLAPDLLHQPGVSIRPPARRGDIDALLPGGPGTVAVVDGTFHSYPAVGHAELRRAVECGWSVWGLSSMGAIRAAEMNHLGVHGFGEVYERFASPEPFDDDEVALLHAAEAPFRPMSEPLIHIRGCLSNLTQRGHLTSSNAAAVLNTLKTKWYADRTLRALRQALIDVGMVRSEVVDVEINQFQQYRSKTTDLIRFLQAKPWQSG